MLEFGFREMGVELMMVRGSTEERESVRLA